MAKIHRFEASLIEVCQGYAQRVDAFDLGQFWAGPEAILDESLSRVQVNWHRCFQLNRLIKAGEDGNFKLFWPETHLLFISFHPF